MNFMGLLVGVLLPGMIAASIFESKGLHPAFGFVLGAVFSWPGMIVAAIAAGIISGSGSSRRHARRGRGVATSSQSWDVDVKTRPARKQAMSADEIRAAREAGQTRLQAHRKRLSALQREAKVLRHNAAAERARSAAEVAARDTLLAAREAEIESLRSALDEAAANREADKVEHDPWYSGTLATADEALPETLLADMPRQSFAPPREEPRARAAGSGDDAGE